jgi:transposase
MPELSEQRCPRCGGRLTIARADHHLGGHEWLYCPIHGNIRRLHARTEPVLDDDADELEEE